MLNSSPERLPRPLVTIVCLLLSCAALSSASTVCKTHLDELCEVYSNGQVSGSLCEPLCTQREIHLEECIGHHGVKLDVMKVDWRGEKLIMKTFRPLGWRKGLASDHFQTTSERHSGVTKSEFMMEANKALFNSILGGNHANSTQHFLEELFSECDLYGDGLLGPKEEAMCWALIQTEEYVLYSVLNKHKGAVPAVRGVCGNVFAVDYATPLTRNIARASWKLRAEVALSLMDMLLSLENTPYGTLHMCDVQEPNYGIVFRSGKQHFAQAIDLDSTWFGDRISAVKFDGIRGQPCRRDSDCEFIHCHVHCDQSKGTCNDVIASNNLQTVCEFIFEPTLLQDSPFSIRMELKKLLHTCSNPPPGSPPQIQMSVFKDLHSLLSKSRHYPSSRVPSINLKKFV